MDELVYKKELIKRENEPRKPAASERIAGSITSITTSDFFMPVIKVVFLLISIILLIYLVMSVVVPYADKVLTSISASSTDAAATNTSFGTTILLIIPGAFMFGIVMWIFNRFSRDYRRWDY